MRVVFIKNSSSSWSHFTSISCTALHVTLALNFKFKPREGIAPQEQVADVGNSTANSSKQEQSVSVLFNLQLLVSDRFVLPQFSHGVCISTRLEVPERLTRRLSP